MQNGGGKAAIGKLAGRSLSLQARQKKTEFEVGIMECLVDRADGLKKGVHKSLKVVKYKGRVTNRSAQDFETKKIEGATTVGAGGVVQIAGQGRQKVRKGEGAGSREENVALLLVEVKAQWGTMLSEEVQDESNVDKANNVIAIIHKS